MIIAVFLAAFVQAATDAPPPADCAVPTPPPVIRPVKPSRPTPPPCVDEARSRHNCKVSVINAYNAQIDSYGRAFESYVAGLNTYTTDLNAYVEGATRYAACERRKAGPDGLIAG